MPIEFQSILDYPHLIIWMEPFHIHQSKNGITILFRLLKKYWFFINTPKEGFLLTPILLSWTKIVQRTLKKEYLWRLELPCFSEIKRNLFSYLLFRNKRFYTWWNCLVKRFKICYIFGIRKPKLHSFCFSFRTSHKFKEVWNEKQLSNLGFLIPKI